MPRPQLDKYWVDRIYDLLANGEGITDTEIARRLEEESSGRGDFPAKRTVNKYRNAFNSLPEDERRQYREFHWPGSMVRADLPWEASEVALELLYFLDLEALPPGATFRNFRHGVPQSRPPIRFVKWFWRVSQAVPAQPNSLLYRLLAAAILTLRELNGDDTSLSPIEWFMVYRPWESKEREQAYERAKSRGINPIPDVLSLLPTTTAGSGDDDLRTWLRSFFSFHFRIELDPDLPSFSEFLKGFPPDSLGDPQTNQPTPLPDDERR